MYILGMISLSRGYLLSSIYLSSSLVYIIEREFSKAAKWMLVASFLSFIGAVHSFEINDVCIKFNYKLLFAFDIKLLLSVPLLILDFSCNTFLDLKFKIYLIIYQILHFIYSMVLLLVMVFRPRVLKIIHYNIHLLILVVVLFYIYLKLKNLMINYSRQF